MGIEGEPPLIDESGYDGSENKESDKVLDFEYFKEKLDSSKKVYETELIINAELERIFAMTFTEIHENNPMDERLNDMQVIFESAEENVQTKAKSVLQGFEDDEKLSLEKRHEVASQIIIESNLSLLSAIRDAKNDPHWGLDDDPDLASKIEKIIADSDNE